MSSIVLVTDDLTAAACIDCDVPGYIVLQPRQACNRLSELPNSVLEQIGPALARLEAAIQSVTDAEHIYVLRFSEGLPTVHFHLFPRTIALANAWLAAARPSEQNIIGPSLFAWARLQYYVANPEMLSPATQHTALRIREYLAEHP